MQLLRRHHQAFVRLALVAMLALACVPTLSRWLVAAQGGPLAWAQVCTPQGMKSLAADDTPAVAGLHLDACGYCTLAGGATPPAVAAGWLAGASAEALPPHALGAAPARAAWTAAQPRAPPRLS